VLLDLMLPDIPGTDVCRRIRGGEARGLQPAVLMLTAKNDEIDRVVGFEIGADDYVVKPVSVRELRLRVGAIVRARRPSPASDPKSNLGCRYLVGPLELDVGRHRIFVKGKEIHASTLEMRLLIYLVGKPRRRTMTKDMSRSVR